MSRSSMRRGAPRVVREAPQRSGGSRVRTGEVEDRGRRGEVELRAAGCVGRLGDGPGVGSCSSPLRPLLRSRGALRRRGMPRIIFCS